MLAGQGEADGMGNGLVYTADMAKKGISEQIEAYGRWRSDLQSAIERYRDWLAQSDAADASLNVKLSQIIERLHDTLLKVAFVAEFSRLRDRKSVGRERV